MSQRVKINGKPFQCEAIEVVPRPTPPEYETVYFRRGGRLVREVRLVLPRDAEKEQAKK